ncbi:choice-of-anchor D domain-containing protein, partial [bacterium]|nr:choice-of-anchor D domain-containing protein [bacterium]
MNTRHQPRASTAALSRGVLTLVLGMMILGAASLRPAYAQLTEEDIAALREHGEQVGWTFKVGETPATGRTIGELCGMLPFFELPPPPAAMALAGLGALPARFDWRDQGLPTVRNQGGCGSCWAFGTVGAFECALELQSGLSEDLSEQWLVSCNQSGWDCSGGSYAFDYFKLTGGLSDPFGGTGAVLEVNFPYTATDATCDGPYPHDYWIDDWAGLSSPTVEEIKEAIFTYGPVSATVHAGEAEFAAYSGGVFNACVDEVIDHLIVLVGWDDTDSGGVWILRNSWGTGWGEDGGYMRIPYGCSRVGSSIAYIFYSGWVTPPQGLESEGNAFAGFSPLSLDYDLYNADSVAHTWNASTPVPWVDISPDSGVVLPGAATLVTMSLNSQAVALSPGYHTTTAIFSNLTAGVTVERTVGVTVTEGLDVAEVLITDASGNGAIDPDECVELSIVLTNLTAVLIAGPIDGHLVAVPSGATVVDSVAVYASIPAAGVATNPVPFRLQTAASYPCGQPLDLVLKLKPATSALIPLDFEVPTGSLAGPPTRFDNATPLPIADLGTVESSNEVSGIAGPIGDIRVSLFIEHTFDADLRLTLVGPDGTEVQLAAAVGGGDDDFGTSCVDANRTVFDDYAATPITSGTAPFVGNFRPADSLGDAFNGKSGDAVNGTWRLRVTDAVEFDVGTLNCWSLLLLVATCEDGGGPCTNIPQVCVSPASLAFPDQALGLGSSTQTVTIANCGTANLVLGDLEVIGPDVGEFALVAPVACAGQTLPPGNACDVEIVFTATSLGPKTATLQFTSNAPDSPHAVELTGNAFEALFVTSPSLLDFGDQLIGVGGVPLTVVIENIGTRLLNIIDVQITGDDFADFSIVGNACSGVPLAPVGACGIQVRFTPGALGLRTAVLEITGDDGNPPQQVLLQGNGVVGVPELIATPSSLIFGDQAVTTTSAVTS